MYQRLGLGDHISLSLSKRQTVEVPRSVRTTRSGVRLDDAEYLTSRVR
jgi:hypothetical protein